MRKFVKRNDSSNSLNTTPITEIEKRLLDSVRVIVRQELNAGASGGRAEWLTTQQAASMLQICPTSLEKARSLGRGPLATIPHHKIGRSVRYARADVITALARLLVPGRVIKS